MATNDQGPGEAGVSGALADLAEAYDAFETPTGEYLLKIVAPTVLLFLALVVVTLVLPVPAYLAVLVVLFGVLGIVTAVLYPKLVRDWRRREIEDSFYMGITHLTVLSTTNISRMEVFEKLAQEREYGEFAVEIDRLVQLVEVWNQSLDDACRRRSRRIPSDAMSDFLDRLAYSLASGQELSDFLSNEQHVILQNYKTIYQGTLENLEVMKDLYLSMILSMTFALVFATVLPVLTGNDPAMTVGAVILLFVLVQTGFFVTIRAIAPNDPVWYHPGETAPPSERRLRRAVAVGVGGTVLVGALVAADLFGHTPVSLVDVLPGDTTPLGIHAAVTVTPLLVPAVALRRAEKRITARDEEFPSFIRALGATESAKQSTTSAVLRDLRRKDFGVLTEDIDNLYRRLNVRIRPERAWAYFTAETRSYLIQKYSQMYLVGRQMGGDPKELGELISRNMNEVLQLRERRHQATITLIGLLYGITAAASFAFYIGIQVVAILADMSLDLDAGSTAAAQLINTASYDIPFIKFLVLVVILFNALLSSLMIRTADGGHKVNSYLHFVLLTWIGATVGLLVQLMVSSLLDI